MRQVFEESTFLMMNGLDRYETNYCPKSPSSLLHQGRSLQNEIQMHKKVLRSKIDIIPLL